MNLNLKRFILIVFVSACYHFPLEAALSPEAESQWEEAFLKESDIKAKISIIEIKQEAACGLKIMFGALCHCTAIYQIDEILKAPEQLGIEADDKVVLNYICDKDKEVDWLGSRLPWVQIGEDGYLIMNLPSHYLNPIGSRQWLLKNEGKIFGPVR